MKLLDFFRNTKKEKPLPKASDPIPEEEKKYYQPEGYYTKRPYEAVTSGRDVITFEERKKTCRPSRTGLYVAEILLLEYCTYGTYPNPQNGYPGLWWFAYGIRNVGAVLKSLETRGYIRYGSASKELKRLKVEELKTILCQHKLPEDGKKDELVARTAANIAEEDLLLFGVTPKYELTELGMAEIEENAYVPYMHKHKTKYKNEFDIWTINALLDINDKSNWKEIVDAEEKRILEKYKRNR